MFPEQHLTDAELVAFSRRFGELEPDRLHATRRRRAAGRPEIRVISDVGKMDVAAGGDDDVGWHTDMSAEALPPPLAESEQLLDRLWRATVKTARIWTHRWAPGDVVIWDSRCTIHRGDPFESGTRRTLYRTQIKSQHPPVPWE